MKVLIEPSTFDCLNMGDVAMLQVAVRRLRKLWPSSKISVLTADSSALVRACPDVTPLPVSGRETWFERRFFLGRGHAYLPAPLSELIGNVRIRVGARVPSAMARIMSLKPGLPRATKDNLEEFVEGVRGTDLFLMSGSGTLNDHFAKQGLRCIETLALGLSQGARLALLGQGIGPLEDHGHRAAVRGILPHLSLLTLREGLHGIPLLRVLGADEKAIRVTGDDAIELANEGRAARPGNALGVNLRVAAHAGVETEMIGRFAEALRFVTDEIQAPVIPIPIALHSYSRDPQVLDELLRLSRIEPCPAGEIVGPRDVIRRISLCRIVVTGAYHAAVFALSQGIPVVGVLSTSNSYYEWKFQGLRDQFNGGIELLSLDGTDFRRELAAMVRNAWDSADHLRDGLIQKAVDQVRRGQAAMEQLKAACDSGDGTVAFS